MSKHCGRTPDCAQSLQSESAGHFYLGSTSDLAKDWETTWARTALYTKTRTLEVGNVWEPSSCPQTRARDQELENLQDDHELIELCANLGDRELFSCRSPSDLPRHDVERPRPRSLSPSTLASFMSLRRSSSPQFELAGADTDPVLGSHPSMLKYGVRTRKFG